MSILAKILGYLKSFSTEDRKAREEIQKVLALPFEQVKQHALELISDSQRFEVVTEHLSENASIEKLGPILQDFFSHFESVKENNGDFFVGRQSVTRSSLRAGFMKIGSDFASSELVTRPGDDRIFIVTDSDHILDGLPTIYHNIVLLE